MEEKDRTLGLRSVVSISVGLVIATSCLAQYTLACLGPFPTLISMVGGYACKDPGSGSISSGRVYAGPGSDRNAGAWNWGSGASAV